MKNLFIIIILIGLIPSRSIAQVLLTSENDSILYIDLEAKYYLMPEKCCLYVELGDVVVVMPNSPDVTLKFIECRSVNPSYENEGFDSLFFYEALKVFHDMYDYVDIDQSKSWASIFTKDSLISECDYNNFIRETIDRRINVEYLESDNKDILQIGKVKMYVYKNHYKNKRRKVPKGYLYVTKQPIK